MKQLALLIKNKKKSSEQLLNTQSSKRNDICKKCLHLKIDNYINVEGKSNLTTSWMCEYLNITLNLILTL